MIVCLGRDTYVPTNPRHRYIALKFLLSMISDLLARFARSLILMETVKYNPIYGAYELVTLSNFRCVYRSSIRCYHPFNPIHKDSKILVKSKYDLTVLCVVDWEKGSFGI